jgi:hypothetical protein
MVSKKNVKRSVFKRDERDMGPWPPFEGKIDDLPQTRIKHHE